MEKLVLICMLPSGIIGVNGGQAPAVLSLASIWSRYKGQYRAARQPWIPCCNSSKLSKAWAKQHPSLSLCSNTSQISTLSCQYFHTPQGDFLNLFGFLLILLLGKFLLILNPHYISDAQLLIANIACFYHLQANSYYFGLCDSLLHIVQLIGTMMNVPCLKRIPMNPAPSFYPLYYSYLSKFSSRTSPSLLQI